MKESLGELLGCFLHCTLECLRLNVPTTTFSLMALRNIVSVTMKQTSHPVNSKTQQKITWLILYCVKSDWFYSIQIWSLKSIFYSWKSFWKSFKSPRTLWNCDTNVKKFFWLALLKFFWGGTFSRIPLRPVLISV